MRPETGGRRLSAYYTRELKKSRSSFLRRWLRFPSSRLGAQDGFRPRQALCLPGGPCSSPAERRTADYLLFFAFFGTKGSGGPTDKGEATDRNGVPFKLGAYDQEHFALVEAIRNNKPFNEGYYGATSSFTAVLGRMATYSGKVIKWDDAVKRGKDYAPGIENYTMQSKPPASAQPDANGIYPIPMPGQYNPFA